MSVKTTSTKTRGAGGKKRRLGCPGKGIPVVSDAESDTQLVGMKIPLGSRSIWTVPGLSKLVELPPARQPGLIRKEIKSSGDIRNAIGQATVNYAPGESGFKFQTLD